MGKFHSTVRKASGLNLRSGLPLESPLIAKTFDDLTAGETDHIDDQTAA